MITSGWNCRSRCKGELKRASSVLVTSCFSRCGGHFFIRIGLKLCCANAHSPVEEWSGEILILKRVLFCHSSLESCIRLTSDGFYGRKSQCNNPRPILNAKCP